MAERSASALGPAAQWRTGLGRAATRSAQVLLVLALVAVAGFVAAQLRLVVVPVLVAILLAAALSPLVSWLTARRAPRRLAVWLVLLVALGLLGGVGWLVGEAVAGQWGELQQGALDGVEQLGRVLGGGPFGLPGLDLDALTGQLTALAQGPELRAGALLGATAVTQFVTGLFLGVVVLYYLLADGARIWRFLRAQLPERAHARVDRAGARSVELLGGYVRGTALIALVDAVLIGIGLLILGVPLAVPLAVVVFLGAFVPIVGSIAAGALAVLVALVSNGPVTALVVIAVVVGVNQLEGSLLQPVVLARMVSLHPLAVLLAVSAGTIVAGIAGAVLAVPVTAVAWTVVSVLRSAEPDPAGDDNGGEARGDAGDPDADVTSRPAGDVAPSSRGAADVAPSSRGAADADPAT